MTLKETRKYLKYNESIDIAIEAVKEVAQIQIEKLKEEKVIVDGVQERMIGICDYYRGKYPNKPKTDEEIIEHFEMLEDKYGNGGRF